MIPHKHLRFGEEHRQALDIQIVRLNTEHGTIPVVASCYDTEIRLSAWNPGRSNWDNLDAQPRWQSAVEDSEENSYWKREHQALRISQEIVSEDYMPDWSGSVGLASGNGYVFLVYARKVAIGGRETAGLFLDRFQWDIDRGLLVHTGFFRVSIGGLTPYPGFVVWAHVTQEWGKLILLFQHMFLPLPELRFQDLRYMTLDQENFEKDLDASYLWNGPFYIDEGGFDFSPIIIGTKLFFIYRREPSVLKIPADSDWTFEIIGNLYADALYSDLAISSLDLSNGQLRYEESHIPGGFNPQIQSIDPLIISFDRIVQGAAAIANHPVSDAAPGDAEYQDGLIASLDIVKYRKILLRKKNERWGRGYLYDLQGDMAVRRQFEERFTNFVVSISDANTPTQTINVSRLLPEYPAFLVGSEQISDKSTALDFLYHSQEMGALIIQRFKVSTYGDDLNAEPQGFSIIDINHGQIEGCRIYTKDTFAENTQFSPFEKASETRYGEFDNLRIWIHLTNAVYDNTIGGCLVLERERTKLNFLAYTDLGDGGCRVIYDEDLKYPEPREFASPKSLPAESVTGPGGSHDKWVSIFDNHTWRASDLPAYLAPYGTTLRSLGSGVQCILDLIAEVSTWGELGATEIQHIQEAIHNSTGPSEDYSNADGEQVDDNDVLSSYQPHSPFTGLPVEFSARTRSENAPQVDYSWDFGDGTSPISGSSVSHTFEIAGEYTVGLSFAYSDGSTGEMRIQVKVKESLWIQSWFILVMINFILNSDIAFVELYDCTVTISKYKIQFKHTDGFAPDKVFISSLDRHDTKFRFHARALTQGVVDFRFPITIGSPRAEISNPWLRPLIVIHNVTIKISYQRPFTPCVLMTDQRHTDPLTGDTYTAGAEQAEDFETLQGQNGPLASALSMKPNGPTSVTVDEVDSDISLKTSGWVIGVITDLLGILGLVTLAQAITLYFNLYQANIANPLTMWVGIVALLMLTYLIFILMPRELKKYVNRKIKESFESEECKEFFDSKTPIADYAGEGLAEALARAVINECVTNGDLSESEGVSANEEGRCRHRDQFWQMIFVTDHECKILIRL